MYAQPTKDFFQELAPAAVEQTKTDRLAFIIGYCLMYSMLHAMIAFGIIFFWWLIFHRNTCNFRLWVQRGFAPFERTFLVTSQWVMYAELGKQKRELDEKKRKAIEQLKDEHEENFRTQRVQLQKIIQPLRQEKRKLEIALAELHGKQRDMLGNLAVGYEKDIRLLRQAIRNLKLEKESSVNEANRLQEQLSGERGAKHKQLLDEHERALAIARTDHDKELAKLKSEHEQQVTALKTQGKQLRQKPKTADMKRKTNINMRQVIAEKIRRKLDPGNPSAQSTGSTAKGGQPRTESQTDTSDPPTQEAETSAEDGQAKYESHSTNNNLSSDNKHVAADSHPVTEAELIEGKPDISEKVEQKEEKQETNLEAGQTEERQDTSEEEKTETLPDPFSLESRHFPTSLKSKASKDLPLESDENSEGSNGDDANACRLSELLTPLRIREVVPVLIATASSSLQLPPPVTLSPPTRDVVTTHDPGPHSAEQSPNTSVPPTGSVPDLAIVPAETQRADIDMGLGNEHTANSEAGILSTGSLQNQASVPTEGQSADVDMGLGNEQTASPSTVIPSTDSASNPSRESAEGQSAEVDMGLGNEQVATSSSMESKDAIMEDTPTVGAPGSADEDMVDAPAVSPPAVKVPVTAVRGMMPAPSTAVPPPSGSPFNPAKTHSTGPPPPMAYPFGSAAAAIQWAAGLYKTPAASPSYTLVENTSMPTLPPLPGHLAAHSPRTAPSFPLGTSSHASTSSVTGLSSAPLYDPLRRNRGSPLAPASSAVSPSSAHSGDPWRRNRAPQATPAYSPPVDPWRRFNPAVALAPAFRSALPPGASPSNTPQHTPRPEVPWLSPRGPGAYNPGMTDSRPSPGGQYMESGSARGAQKIFDQSSVASRPSTPCSLVPLEDLSNSNNVGGVGSSGEVPSTSRPKGTATMPNPSAAASSTPSTAEVPNVQATPSGNARRLSHSSAAKATLPTPNSPTTRAPSQGQSVERRRAQLTEAQRKQAQKDDNAVFGKPRNRRGAMPMNAPAAPKRSEPPKNLLNINGDDRYTRAQMYGTPITSSPAKSVPKRGSEEMSDASINSKRQRPEVEDSEVNASTSTALGATMSSSTDVTHPLRSGPKRAREEADEEKTDDAGIINKRQRSALGDGGGAAPSTVAAPGELMASTGADKDEEDKGAGGN